MAKEHLPNQEVEIQDSDFTFVQKDDHLHDKSFKTRPTTFFKDAMKRFVKNKSSVVAAGILAILILMAIIVPVADRNSIKSTYQEIQYLPPKWFSGDMNGFMDGTKTVNNVVLDPHERDADGKYLLPEGSSYIQNAIIGDISAASSYANELTDSVSKYGKGGYITLMNTGYTDRATDTWSSTGDAGIMSSDVTFEDTETVSFEADIDEELTKATVLDESEMNVYLAFSYDTVTEEGIYNNLVALTEPISLLEGEYATLRCDDVVAKLSEIDPTLTGTISGKFGLMLSDPYEVKYTNQTVYIKRLVASASASDVAIASFSDATKALTKIQDEKDETHFLRQGSAKLGIYHSEVLYGTFRYDCYKAIFGSTDDDDPKPVFTTRIYSGDDVNVFIENGWMEYEWGHGTNLGQFHLTELGKKYCPVRDVLAQDVREDPFHPGDEEYITRELTVKCSYYRHLAYKGIIGDYNPPKYVFGTDQNGKDFFKVVFSGLLMSLGLGFLSAGINITIGLIWGAIAGYFGGWVDLLMERFVEILSGMPWIVMMTLIVLLTGSNSFGIFLLALCITGWIGISGVTRSQFYRYKRREYVLASRTLGASDARLIFRHILPNAIGTIVTSAVLMIPGVIFTEANIAYLLPGTMQLAGSFGVSLSNVQGDLKLYPYLIVSASIIMALIMISFNLFGNGLRDAFNPSLKGSDE